MRVELVLPDGQKGTYQLRVGTPDGTRSAQAPWVAKEETCTAGTQIPFISELSRMRFYNIQAQAVRDLRRSSPGECWPPTGTTW